MTYRCPACVAIICLLTIAIALTNQPCSYLTILLLFLHDMYLILYALGLGVTIILQIITGIFLCLHYTSDLELSYIAVIFLFNLSHGRAIILLL